MTTPFRSDAEHVREQLRRAEERLTDLAAEKAELERMIAVRPRARAWIVALAVGFPTLFGGWAVGRFDAKKAAIQERIIQEARHVAENEREHERTAEAERTVVLWKAKAWSLEKQLALCEARPNRSLVEPPQHINRPPCTCQPGDPLCSCP